MGDERIIRTLPILVVVLLGTVPLSAAQTIHEPYWAPGFFETLRDARVIIRGMILQKSSRRLEETGTSGARKGTEVRGEVDVQGVLRGNLRPAQRIPYRSISLEPPFFVPEGDPVLTEPWNNVSPKDGVRVLLVGDGLRKDGTFSLHTYAEARAYGYHVLEGGERSPFFLAVRRFLEIAKLPVPEQGKAFVEILGTPEGVRPDLLKRLAIYGLTLPEIGDAIRVSDRSNVLASYLTNPDEPLAFREALLSQAAKLVGQYPKDARTILEAYLTIWRNTADFNRMRELVLLELRKHVKACLEDEKLAGALRNALADPALAKAEGRYRSGLIIVDAHGIAIQPAYNTDRLEKLRAELMKRIEIHQKKAKEG